MDPDEPVLSEGFPYRAIAYAFKDARQTHARPTKRFNPKSLVKRIVTVCPLSDKQKVELECWLKWLNDRRYITRDGYQSPVLQWLLSGPKINSSWQGDADDFWKSRVNEEHKRREAAKREAAEARANEEDKQTAKRDAADGGSTAETAESCERVEREQAVGSSNESVTATASSANSPTPLERPKMPFGALADVQGEAKEFLKAYLYSSDNELRKAALALSSNPEAFAEATSRNDEQTRCVETVFKHFGLLLTGSKP